jgi:hypothetical protein
MWQENQAASRADAKGALDNPFPGVLPQAGCAALRASSLVQPTAAQPPTPRQREGRGRKGCVTQSARQRRYREGVFQQDDPPPVKNFKLRSCA